MATATATKPKPAPAAQDPPAGQLTKLTQANVAGFLFSDHIKSQIAIALPQHLTPERMIRMALTTVRRTPKLLECDPRTLVACIVQASELGLELSGPLGQAYMIPRRNHGKMEACFQIGYRGWQRLAFNTGQVAYFNARAVRQGDYFLYSLGTSQSVEHRREAPRGAKITHFYSVLKQTNQFADCEVWSLAEMEDHRDRYRSDKFLVGKNGYRGPWDDSFEAMGAKTMILQLAKRAQCSAELMSLAAKDEYDAVGFPIPNVAAEFMAPLPPASAKGNEPEPDTLDEIDAQLLRTGTLDEAAVELFTKHTTEGDELTQAGALAMLKELQGMPDRTA